MISNTSVLDQYWARGTALLGTRYALLAGAMTWVSERNLVAAISNAGGFGVLASGSMEPSRLEEEIQATQKLTRNPFGVNLITLHPQLEQLVATCIKNGVTHVVLAGGLPQGSTIDILNKADIKTLCFAPSLALAKKLHRMGADGIIIEGMEAGGHIGPVSTTVLAQEILPNFKDVPVFVAGGIGRGETIGSYLQMGAAGCQLGTRFVCATESTVHPNFKKAFIRAQARHALPSVQLDDRFPIIPVRAIENDATKKFREKQKEVILRFEQGLLDKNEAQLEIEHFWAGALRKAAVDGDIDGGSIMAGQSVGMVKSEQPVQEIIDELIGQAASFFKAKNEDGEALQVVG